MIQDRGFTLFELMIVIVILGILAPIIVIGLRGARTKARNATARADLESIESAILTYEQRHYTYPPVSGWETYLQNDEPRLIDRIPEDPWASGGAKYVYDLDTTSTPGTYLILSVGEDQTRDAQVGDDIVTNKDDDIIATNAKTISD
ncbi:MAG TPA: prepilin-type N-terminal cleavage/methylation domain-containing protein [Candidatus Omnitrophica bacterium]|nr:prepilin-type N-terminal cleavage/methylation domain-containing protein [Candidatus Omnitrophota bacterium]